MFAVVKLVEQLLFLPSLIVIGLLVVLGLWSYREKLAQGLLIALICVLYVFSIEPTAFFLTQSLQGGQRSLGFDQRPDVDVIVVLAGGSSKESDGTHAELSGASLKRFWHGIEQYNSFGGAVPLLYSGGSGDAFDQDSNEATLARSYALSIGVPEENMWIENRSRNTYESAVAMKALLDDRFNDDEHSVMLVTSATHMKRSKLTLESVGISVVPAPADFGLATLNLDPQSLIPSATWLYSSNVSLHEWAGIAWYSLSGRI